MNKPMGQRSRLFFALNILLSVGLFFVGDFSTKAVAEEVEAICYTCHTKNFLSGGYRICSVWIKSGHPVYVVPSKKIKIPSEFPLNKKGQIFCGTCHTAGAIDNNVEDREPQIYSRKVFLRYENVNSSFCKQCHVQKGGEERVSVAGKGKGFELLHEKPVVGEERKKEAEKTFNHPVDIATKRIPKRIIEYGGNTGTNKDMLICETCHKAHRAGGEKLLVLNNSNSELCGICHPGMWANDREGASTKGTHPVNVLPSTAVISRSVVASGGKIEARGKMICLTCHKTHNAPVEKGLLVIKNDQDAFCIECHSIEENAVKNTKHDLRYTAPDERNIVNRTARRSGICSPCHLAHNGTGAKIWAKKIVDYNTDAISQLCESCHSLFSCAQSKQVGEFSHPVNVELKTAGEVRTSLPLFSQKGIQAGIGLVTCATCHDSHRWNPKSESKANAIGRDGNHINSFLRKQNIKSSLCYECHAEKKLILKTKHDPQLMPNPKAANSGLCAECHSVHNAGFYMLWNREVGSGGDNLSKICNSCHAEGKIAREKVLDGYNHPLNVNIFKLGRYVNTLLPLFNNFMGRSVRGNILCNTCHDSHRWDPKVNRIKDFVKAQATAENSFLRISANSETESLCDSCHNEMRWIISSEHDLSVTAPNSKNLQGKTTAQSGVCGACHASHRGANSFLLWNRKQGPGKDKLTKLCNSCHAEGEIAQAKQVGANSHPLLIPMQEKQRPKHLPLFDDDLKISIGGKIYCPTCHNTHRWDPTRLANGPGKNIEGDDTTSFLRISNDMGYLLCIDCHPNKELIEGTEHDLSVSAPKAENILGQNIDQAGLCGTCHLAHNSNIVQQLWARDLGPGEDMISRLCSSCHSKGKCAQSKVAGPGSHPLNASMLAADGDTDFPLYTPDGKQDNENGRVFCSTCHDPHKWDSTLQARGDGKLAEGSLQNSFLRLSNMPKPLLCGNCHQNHLRVQNSPHDLSITAPKTKNIVGQTVGEAGVCSPCHLSHNTPSPVRMWAQATGPGSLPGWTEKYAVAEHHGVSLCTGCHAPGKIAGQKIPPRALHPKNIFALLKQPVFTPAVQALPYFDYPIGQGKLRISTSAIRAGVRPRFPTYAPDGQISQNGDITCPTCHNPHQLTAESPRAVTSATKSKFKRNFLRENIQTNFCTDCHGAEAIYDFTYYHRQRNQTLAQTPTNTDSPHWREGACSACHAGTPGKNTLKAGGDVNVLCAECHKTSHRAEIHPTGVSVAKTARQESSTLPLNANNQLSCLTCHQLRGHNKPDRSVLDNNPYFLRQPRQELLAAFTQKEKDAEATNPSPDSAANFSLRQTKAKRRKKKKEKKVKSYNYVLCYECHSQESYAQFDIHRYQLTAKGKINQEMCFLCHSGIPDLSTTDPDEFKLNTSLDNYCVGCHRKQMQAHPSEADHYGKKITDAAYKIIKSFTKVGNYFIPFSDMRMTCTTCHNPHQAGVSKNKAAMKGEDERWRLRFVGYEVCAICHRGSYGTPTRESPF